MGAGSVSDRLSGSFFMFDGSGTCSKFSSDPLPIVALTTIRGACWGFWKLVLS